MLETKRRSSAYKRQLMAVSFSLTGSHLLSNICDTSLDCFEDIITELAILSTNMAPRKNIFCKIKMTNQNTSRLKNISILN